MLSFECDYNNGAHPDVLQRLLETNRDAQVGYGEDVYTNRAIEKIRAFCGTPHADVYLLTGGTQTNVVVLTAILEPFEGGHLRAYGPHPCP